MFRSLVVLPLCWMMAVGCHMPETERGVVELGDGLKPEVETTGFAGNFKLYRVPEEQYPLPLYGLALERGDTIGFRRQADGSVAAVAGAKTITIVQSPHEWRGTPAPGQIDPVRTTILVGSLVLGAVVVGAVLYEGYFIVGAVASM